MLDPIFQTALLVEDELQLALALQIALKKMKIQVSHVFTIKEARKHFSLEIPDFILLDRSLPDGDGLQLCRELREARYAGMILVLTASGTLEDRVQGLNVGADDYLPKPFSWEELEARVRALGRRAVMEKVCMDSLWMSDVHQLRILGPKGWVVLTPLEFKLANYLINHCGRIISRDSLLKEVWGFAFLPRTRTVDHFLGRLRKYFESNPEEPLHFLTIRGAGYKFQR
jgi:DNA-binding response OmpR family regulator